MCYQPFGKKWIEISILTEKLFIFHSGLKIVNFGHSNTLDHVNKNCLLQLKCSWSFQISNCLNPLHLNLRLGSFTDTKPWININQFNLFMSPFSFYKIWKYHMVHRKRPVAWNGLRCFIQSFTFVTQPKYKLRRVGLGQNLPCEKYEPLQKSPIVNRANDF